MKTLCVAALAAASLIVVPAAHGSSHREAPNIMLDPSADDTDTYAFTADDAPGAITIVANWVPGGNPSNGPNFFRFDDKARYYINIDNTGDGKADIRDRYTFHSNFSDSSILYALPGVASISDPKLIQKQTYSIVREFLTNGKLRRTKTLAKGLPVAPSNTGTKTFPDYDKVANEAILTVGDMKVFAGQRDDAFFIDLGLAFDNIHERFGTGNIGGDPDTQAGTSIQTITTQIPEADVTRDHKAVTGEDDPEATVGVWASTERRKLQVSNSRFDNLKLARGSWVQVSRLANPLINELFVPAGKKDKYNATRPDTDDARIKQFLLTPELAANLNTLLPTALAPTKNRDDLVQVLLTGVPGLNQIDKTNAIPTDTLKLNMGTPPSATPNRFGLLGNDRAGFPNGRRLADDATDIIVQLAAGFMKGVKLPLGDGVDQNDKPFLSTFPYQASPDNGFEQKVGQRVEPPHAPTLPGNDPPLPLGKR